MLKIWYYANIDYMKDAPSYFDNVYEDEWIEDTFVKEMIQDVDHCEVISPHIIDSPILGAITPRELSGGVKVLILMLKDDSFIYNMSNCGDNCAKWVLKIAEKKDLTVYLQHIMHFEGGFKIQIMNTGKIVCNPKEYVAELLEAEEMEDERKLLISLTANGVEEYSKTKLNSFYLQDGIVEKIIEQLPEEIDLER